MCGKKFLVKIGNHVLNKEIFVKRKGRNKLAYRRERFVYIELFMPRLALAYFKCHFKKQLFVISMLFFRYIIF